MTQNTDVQELQRKAEARLASLKDEKFSDPNCRFVHFVRTRQNNQTAMIGMSIETHKTSPDFDQKKCNQAKSRIMQALGDIDCDMFIEMDR